MVSAGQLEVGDQVISVNIPGIPDDFWTLQSSDVNSYEDYVLSQEQVNGITETVATVVGKDLHESPGAAAVNGDIYSMNHYLLVKRNDEVKVLRVDNLTTSDLIFNYQTQDFAAIESYELNTDIVIQTYSINVEPQDFFFTENGLTFDLHPLASGLQGSDDPDGSGPL